MATTQTATTAKPTTAKPAAAPKAPKPATEIATVRTAALSTDVGPRILGMFVATDKAVTAANEAIRDAKAKGYQMLSELTVAIRKAAENDPDINLSAAFRSDDRAAVNKLNDQIRIAIGISEAKELSTGIKKLVETNAAGKYWSKMTKTQRTNFSHMLKKTAQSAAGLMDLDAKATIDAKTGTLLIEGPKVKAQFGQPSVSLNEKVTVGEGESAITLSKKPSFQAVADIAKLNRDIVPARRADSRAATASPGSAAPASYTTDAAFTALAKIVVDAVTKIPTLSVAQVTAARSMISALTAKLGKAA